MAEAMDDIKDYEFIAIFDADFHPEPDFLLKCIPYLKDNSDVGFVQARWTYANGNEVCLVGGCAAMSRRALTPMRASQSILTRVQEISLSYHSACPCRADPHFSHSSDAPVVPTAVKCEQYARFATGAFFNFNGTAGIWRRATIEKAGGWNARTTVEDMDLSLRAYLQGWRFVFLYDVTVCAPHGLDTLDSGGLTDGLLSRASLAVTAVPQRAAQLIRRVQEAAAPLVVRADAAVAQGHLRGVGLQHQLGPEALPEHVRPPSRLAALPELEMRRGEWGLGWACGLTLLSVCLPASSSAPGCSPPTS